MFEPFRDIRIGRLPLALLACVSGVATAVILSGGGDRSGAQVAALAALQSSRTVIEQSSGTPAGGPASSGPTSSGSSGGSAGGSASAATGSTGSSGADSSAGSGSTNTPTGTTTTGTTTTQTDAGLPHVGHVFLIALSISSYADAFGGRSKAPYLRALTKRGTVLSGFHSLGNAELPDLLAMVSGQAPNRSTEGDCSSYVPFPASAAANSTGIVPGHGCVYPDTALTIADQTTSAGKSWGAYIADSGSTNCPVPNTGASLTTPIGGTGEGYDLLHNPFAFFGSLLDAGGCSASDEDLTNLPKALRRASSTPAFTYVGADACADGDPQMVAAPTTTTATSTTTSTSTATPTSTTTPTTTATTTTTSATTTTTSTAASAPAAAGCSTGSQSGIAAEDTFLKTWVPRILRSAAYRRNGVLVIAFTGDGGRRGARTGALVLSRWTRHGKKLKGSYGPYSLLHSLEDMLDFQPLAHAATAAAFAKSVL